MAAPQKPETFMLSTEAQQALPRDAQVALQQVDNLKYFLISAPVDWQQDQYIRRFLLPTGEYVSCVLWNNLFHISGTDIVRCLSFRFQAFGRPVKNSKKFEEGIFSDLRNLKSGTDASLEEPKSAFLDFLYKNNCIRTQKKQKVFYWYSVPHDRLFLDALERDLKREKMGQEATTIAVSEPAVSFQYDSSQSLYDQLTKAQQANSSSFNAQAQAAAAAAAAAVSFSAAHAASPPVMRELDGMPPPQLIAATMAPLPDGLDAMVPFQTMASMAAAMVPPLPQQHQHQHQQRPMIKRESVGVDYGRMSYGQGGVSLSQPPPHVRHASMPPYGLEYSPAPSFVSSQYDDYGARGISFEPITPPHHSLGLGTEPAYIANEETGLYTAIPDHLAAGMSGMIQLPPSNLAGPPFSRGGAGGGGCYGGPSNHHNNNSNNVYSVIEGSPTYKQRRRRSSIPPSMSAIAAATATATVHRQSDLRRSVSTSVGPLPEDQETNSPPALSYSTAGMSMTQQQQHHQHQHQHQQDLQQDQQLQQLQLQHQQHRDLLDMSRHSTPLSGVDVSPIMNPLNIQPHQDFSALPTDLAEVPMEGRRTMHQGPGGAVRRARSATMMELGPYPQKSHSCPIPTCGRLFKRLEHLKRHVRTHTQEKPYVCSHCSRAFSRSDNLAQHKRTHDKDGGEGPFSLSGEDEDEYSGEDQAGSLDDASPTSESAYITASLNSIVNGASPPQQASTPMSTGTGVGRNLSSLQTLSMPMTMSTPAGMI